ncbi:hypothetical protein HDU93_002021, partial [Gonapodya sp. JEL0774]
MPANGFQPITAKAQVVAPAVSAAKSSPLRMISVPPPQLQSRIVERSNSRSPNTAVNSDSPAANGLAAVQDTALVEESVRGRERGRSRTRRRDDSATGSGLVFKNRSILTQDDLLALRSSDKRAPSHSRGRSRSASRRRGSNISTRLSADSEFIEGTWNDRYQALLARRCEGDAEEMQRDVKLCELIGSFQEVVRAHVKRIIDEFHLKPVDESPETAGTYVFGDILFQFAATYSDDFWAIYAAHAKSNSELRALNALNGANLGLNTALLAAVEYKGFRVVAYAIMPLEDKTLVRLGVDREATESLSHIGQALNLSRSVDDKKDTTYQLPETIEVYRGQLPGSFYVLNLADLFPADPATTNVGDLARGDRRLRPEFIVKCPKSITLLAGSRNNQNGAAISFMKEQLIPQVVRALDSLDQIPFDSQSLTEILHRNGVNIRFVGTVADLTKRPFVREMALIEMASRACKHLLRSRLRRQILQFRSMGAKRVDEELATNVVSFFAMVLNPEKSKRIWDDKLRQLCRQLYEYDMDHYKFVSLNRKALFLSLQHHCGVVFDDDTEYNFDPMDVATLRTKLRGCEQRIKLTEGIFQANKADNEDWYAYSLGRHMALLGANERLGKHLGTSARMDALARFYLSDGRPADAQTYAEIAVNLAPRNHAAAVRSLTTWIEALVNASSEEHPVDMPKVSTLYEQAVAILTFHFDLEHLFAINLNEAMAAACYQSEQKEDATTYQNLAVEASLRTLGKSHVVTAKSLLKGGTYLAISSQDEALNHLRDALQILPTLDHEEPTLEADINFQVAEILSSKGDHDAAREKAL